MQQDLFDSGAGKVAEEESPKKDQQTFLQRFRISLRFDHALLLGIVFIVLFALFFSFGVESGKRFAKKDLIKNRQANAEQVDRLKLEVSRLKTQLANLRLNNPELTPVAENVPVPNEVLFAAHDAPQEQVLPKEEPVKDAVSESLKGKYTIQTVTYKTETEAARQIEKYKKLGFSSFTIPSGSYIQVCVNAFESKSKAVKELKQMKTEGTIPSDAFVRPIPHS